MSVICCIDGGGKEQKPSLVVISSNVTDGTGLEMSLSTGRLSRQKNKNILFVWAVTDSSLGIDFGAGGSFLVSTFSVCDKVHSVLTH